MNIGYLRRDDDCHWYLVPEDKIMDFDALLDRLPGDYLDAPELFNKFEEEFGEYRIDGYYNIKCVIEEESYE